MDATALTISIIGAINWGLIGFFNFNLVSFLFGSMTWLSRIIYAIVGICGIYLLSFYTRTGKESPVPQTDTRGRVEHTKALRDSWLRN